jgi:hypothetical protein
VETDSSSSLNSQRFNLLPREVPELIRRMLLSTQQSYMNKPMSYDYFKSSAMRKRSDDEIASLIDEKNSEIAADTSIDKRGSSSESNENDEDGEAEIDKDKETEYKSERKKRIKKRAVSAASQDDNRDSLNEEDSEYEDKLKSLKRRNEYEADDTASSYEDNESPIVQSRNEDELEELED